MKTRVNLGYKDIDPSKPVEWDIFDESDRLLLKQGMQLHSKKQLKKLVEIGAYRYEFEEDKPIDASKQRVHDVLSPFVRIERVEHELEFLLKETFLLSKNDNVNLTNRYLDLVDELIDLCEYDIDAVLGAIHTDEQNRYTVVHPLHSAVLVYIIGKRINIPTDRLICIMAATLTSNVGMYELQEVLHGQTDRLSDEQKIEVEKHPLRSVRLLKRAGITNKLWLEIVAQHHEQQDGRGYPRRIRGPQFIKEARIVAMADRYHAMISPRSYRKGLTPTMALKHLFQTRGKVIDEKIGAIFIKELGIYPPGTYVRLKNGETALVTRRGSNSMRPKVKSLLSSQGLKMRKPLVRNCADRRFAVLGLCPPLSSYKKDLSLLWDYTV
ncbi:MAG: HD domain-containing protein [Gammaproteobacteria bacterium]|nr:HD domain-containing protein [Gammaproteobacteria bacterium]